MWNGHSLAKWVYAVPYVDAFHVFEMPLLGYAGYLPFGLACLAVGDAVAARMAAPVPYETRAATLGPSPKELHPSGRRQRSPHRMKAGIESYALYTPEYYIELEELARVRGVDPDKYRLGLGQERMAVPPPDEDVVTMAASAARRALAGVDTDTIDTVIFATESGVDQSKAAAIYVHRLLGLPRSCRTFEVKQACSGSTAALQMALALVRERPDRPGPGGGLRRGPLRPGYARANRPRARVRWPWWCPPNPRSSPSTRRADPTPRT